MPLPVYGPYHAFHLHSTVEIEKVLRLQDSQVAHLFQEAVPKIALLSCSTGLWYREQDPKALLVAIVRDILNHALQFHKVLAACADKAQNHRGATCLVIPFGPTHAAKALVATLKSQTGLEVVLRQAPSIKDWPSPVMPGKGSCKRSKLAIVGMAGRFPDAASHEKLWELLEQGLDVHREVRTSDVSPCMISESV